MDIRYREAGPEDMPACVDLFLESVEDLRRRHNLPSDRPPQAKRMLAFYQHTLSTGIFHVAEADGRIAALACAIVRDHLWFLAGFWARPGLQQQHIGMTVLRGVWGAGKQAGATHLFVWSSSDLPAMAAYMKLGMLPGSQIMAFEGSPQPPATVPLGYATQPLRRAFALAMDRTVLGTGREVDHSFLTRVGWQGREVLQNGKSVGYYYLEGGSIGPAAWAGSEHGAALLALAFSEASASDSEVSLQVPGMNHAALRFAFDSGLRLRGFAHLLMSAPFGHLEQYIPSGPSLF
jgi:hypothetical protein